MSDGKRVSGAAVAPPAWMVTGHGPEIGGRWALVATDFLKGFRRRSGGGMGGGQIYELIGGRVLFG